MYPVFYGTPNSSRVMMMFSGYMAMLCGKCYCNIANVDYYSLNWSIHLTNTKNIFYRSVCRIIKPCNVILLIMMRKFFHVVNFTSLGCDVMLINFFNFKWTLSVFKANIWKNSLWMQRRDEFLENMITENSLKKNGGISLFGLKCYKSKV